MANPRCQAILNIETVSQAFKNHITSLTTEITNCLYDCFLDNFVGWAVINYTDQPPDVINDIANQSFTDGVQKFSEKATVGLYDGNASIKTIFFNFFRLQLLSHLQTEKRLRDKNKNWSYLQDKATSDPEKTADEEALLQKIENALQQMESIDRQIILWRHLEQKRNDEIAALLDITVDAATNRIYRCMVRLRKIMKSTN